MASELDNPVTEGFSDRSIVDFLRREGSSTIIELMQFAGVTATAIRQRLNRLMEQGLIVRQAEVVGRGRPTHRYSLSPAGIRCGGDNYEDLAGALWLEIRAVKDPDVRHGLLKRILCDHAADHQVRGRDQVDDHLVLAEGIEHLTNEPGRMEHAVGVDVDHTNVVLGGHGNRHPVL